jgi:hypothetical protein
LAGLNFIILLGEESHILPFTSHTSFSNSTTFITRSSALPAYDQPMVDIIPFRREDDNQAKRGACALLIGSPQTNSPLKAIQQGVNIFQDGTQF